MNLNELAEELAEVVEPWTTPPAVDDSGSRTATADSGTTVDLNMRRPVEHDADHLYVWPTVHTHTPEGAGNPPEEREDFVIQLLYTAEREGEEAQLHARRDVSDALVARAELYAQRVRDNRSKFANGSAAPWQHIFVASVQHDTTVTFGVRGIGLLVTGYRYL